MAYELGAGLGIALFGLILTRSYSASIALPSGLSLSLIHILWYQWFTPAPRIIIERPWVLCAVSANSRAICSIC